MKTEKKRFKAKIINIKCKWLYPKNCMSEVGGIWSSGRVKSLTGRLLLQVTEVSTTCAKVINTCQSYVWTQKGLTGSLFTNVTQGWMQKRLIKERGGVQLVYTDEANNVHPSLTVTDVHPLAPVIRSVHVAFFSCKGQSLKTFVSCVIRPHGPPPWIHYCIAYTKCFLKLLLSLISISVAVDR